MFFLCFCSFLHTSSPRAEAPPPSTRELGISYFIFCSFIGSKKGAEGFSQLLFFLSFFIALDFCFAFPLSLSTLFFPSSSSNQNLRSLHLCWMTSSLDGLFVYCLTSPLSSVFMFFFRLNAEVVEKAMSVFFLFVTFEAESVGFFPLLSLPLVSRALF